MQPRFACRTALNVGVEMRHNGVRLGRYRTRDIDANAVFIEAADSGLNLHEMVEVDFLIEKDDWRRFRRKGVVVRRAPDGLAVMFVTEDTVFYQALEELLGAPPTAQKAGSHG